MRTFRVAGLAACVWLAMVAVACGGTPAAAPPAAAGLERDVKCLADTVPAGLPVPLKITWHNASQKAVEFAPEDLRTVTVEKAGAAARTFAVRTLPAISTGTLTLDAGKSVSRVALLVLGREAGKTGLVPLEWLFPEPGKYQVSLEGFPSGAPMAVTVEEPKSEADRAARCALDAGDHLLPGRRHRQGQGPPAADRTHLPATARQRPGRVRPVDQGRVRSPESGGPPVAAGGRRGLPFDSRAPSGDGGPG